MSTLIWVLVFTTIGGVCSALFASLFLLASPERRRMLLPHLLSFATGAQLGVAYLALYPQASQEVGKDGQMLLGLLVVAGLVAFFMLEKWMRWHHHDGGSNSPGDMPAGSLILIGDGVHNGIHGVLIAASFMTSINLGVVITVAVLAHEIPLEVSDVAVLLASGKSRMTAFALNGLAGLATTAGGLIAYFAFDQTHKVLPYVLTIAIANLTYISLADLVPNMHQRTGLRAALWQFSLIAIGVVIIVVMEFAIQGA